jgi:mannose-6-phosphate isomerase-like protein (cupin superfamily)
MSFLAYPPPRYSGLTGRVSARYRPVHTPPDVVAGREGDGPVEARQRLHYLATGADTGGEFGLYRVDMPPHGPGPDLHFHRGISESFFVLSGSVALHNGQQWVDAAPGDFLYVPVGGLHAFRNTTDEPASMLLLFAPGAPREGYFEGLREVEDMTEEQRREFFLVHDNHWV